MEMSIQNQHKEEWKETTVLVAVIEGCIQAYTVAWLVGDELQVIDLAVDRAWRRQGLGSLLMARLIKMWCAPVAEHLSDGIRDQFPCLNISCNPSAPTCSSSKKCADQFPLSFCSPWHKIPCCATRCSFYWRCIPARRPMNAGLQLILVDVAHNCLCRLADTPDLQPA